jgi:hypothetical protein
MDLLVPEQVCQQMGAVCRRVGEFTGHRTDPQGHMTTECRRTLHYGRRAAGSFGGGGHRAELADTTTSYVDKGLAPSVRQRHSPACSSFCRRPSWA